MRKPNEKSGLRVAQMKVPKMEHGIVPLNQGLQMLQSSDNVKQKSRNVMNKQPLGGRD